MLTVLQPNKPTSFNQFKKWIKLFVILLSPVESFLVVKKKNNNNNNNTSCCILQVKCCKACLVGCVETCATSNP